MQKFGVLFAEVGIVTVATGVAIRAVEACATTAFVVIARVGGVVIEIEEK